MRPHAAMPHCRLGRSAHALLRASSRVSRHAAKRPCAADWLAHDFDEAAADDSKESTPKARWLTDGGQCHCINVEVKDNHESAKVGALDALRLCELVISFACNRLRQGIVLGVDREGQGARRSAAVSRTHAATHVLRLPPRPPPPRSHST